VLDIGPYPNAATRIGKGAFYGSVVGLALLAIGLVRALVAVVFGHTLESLTAADLRPGLFYLGGFAVAGATLGLAVPLFRYTLGVYLGGCFAGMIVMLAIALGDDPAAISTGRLDWFPIIGLGAFFGCALAFGATRAAKHGTSA
jgi:hypothetical protein